MDTHITSGDRMCVCVCVCVKSFYVVIHYLAGIFQYAVHYIFANFKIISNTRMKTEILTEICMRLLENICHLHECSG
jgi:hypothetical protein